MSERAKPNSEQSGISFNLEDLYARIGVKLSEPQPEQAIADSYHYQKKTPEQEVSEETDIALNETPVIFRPPAYLDQPTSQYTSEGMIDNDLPYEVDEEIPAGIKRVRFDGTDYEPKPSINTIDEDCYRRRFRRDNKNKPTTRYTSKDKATAGALVLALAITGGCIELFGGGDSSHDSTKILAAVPRQSTSVHYSSSGKLRTNGQKTEIVVTTSTATVAETIPLQPAQTQTASYNDSTIPVLTPKEKHQIELIHKKSIKTTVDKHRRTSTTATPIVSAPAPAPTPVVPPSAKSESPIRAHLTARRHINRHTEASNGGGSVGAPNKHRSPSHNSGGAGA
jgi:hypothetical protein